MKTTGSVAASSNDSPFGMRLHISGPRHRVGREAEDRETEDMIARLPHA